MRAIPTKTIQISFTVLLLLSSSRVCYGLPGCWIFGFIWDACYEKAVAKELCCRSEDFAGTYTGYSYSKPSAGPYYWGDRLELNIKPLATNTNGDGSCLHTIIGTLSIEKKNPDTQKYEHVTEWNIHIACTQDNAEDAVVVPFYFQLKDWTNETASAGEGELLQGEGKLWRVFGGQIDLRFNDGAGIVEIQMKRNP